MQQTIDRTFLCKLFYLLVSLMGSDILFPCVSQTAENPKMSISQAVETALANNPNLEAAQKRITGAEEKIAQADAGLMPQAYLSQRYSHTDNPMWALGTRLNQERITAADFDPGRLNNPDAIDNFATSVSVSWPVYDSGRTWYGRQQARLNHEAVNFMTNRVRQQVIGRTIMSYVGVLLSDENLKVMEQTLETARTHFSMVESRFKGGFVVKSDLLRAQVHIADLEQQRLQAQSQTDISRCMLNVAMGVDGNMRYELNSPLEKGKGPDESLDVWIAKALSTRPDLIHLKLQENIADKEVNKARSAHYPSVSLEGNYELNSEKGDDFGDNYNIGALVSLNLYSGGRISAGIREARASQEEVNAMIRATEQQVCGETRQAFFNAQSAWERIKVAQAATGQAEESLRIVQNRYNSGLFTITDLLDSETALHQARTNHLRAVHDYRVAAVQLALAAGTLDENFQ
ncbi:MAG: TolC family protein [Desulfococcaceae bacterium]